MVFDDSTPIYLQIAEQIRTAILDGSLPEGDQVMSTTQYATTYRINPATAAKGLNTLVDERLIEKRRGLGMFVLDGARESLLEARRATFFEEALAPVIAEAQALGFTKQQIISHIEETS